VVTGIDEAARSCEEVDMSAAEKMNPTTNSPRPVGERYVST
jgi:hypothetical protein